MVFLESQWSAWCIPWGLATILGENSNFLQLYSFFWIPVQAASSWLIALCMCGYLLNQRSKESPVQSSWAFFVWLPFQWSPLLLIPGASSARNSCLRFFYSVILLLTDCAVFPAVSFGKCPRQKSGPKWTSPLILPFSQELQCCAEWPLALEHDYHILQFHSCMQKVRLRHITASWWETELCITFK